MPIAPGPRLLPRRRPRSPPSRAYAFGLALILVYSHLRTADTFHDLLGLEHT